MEPLRQVHGTAAPLPEPNISTDILVPSRVITSASRDGFGRKLFAGWRYRDDGSEDPGFVLNQPAWRDSRILVTGANFGCGSSREMAVWALVQFGIRCVVAPSFAPIFRDNCVRNGLLPVTLAADDVARLAALAQHTPQGWTADLQDCRLSLPDGTAYNFSFDARERDQLLLGLDPIGITLRHSAAIDAFVHADRKNRPWIWL